MASSRSTAIQDMWQDLRGSRRASSVMGTGALVGAFLLLAISAVGLNVNLATVAESRELVLRTSAILRQVAELHVDLRAAETGQRGYIITGERRYLAPYENAIRQVWSSFAELDRLVQDPEQQNRLQRLRPLVLVKLDELAQTVALRAQSLEAAVQVVRTDTGQKLTEDIEDVLRGFRTRENDLLFERTRRLESDVATTTRVAGLTGLLAVASTILGVVWLARQRSRDRLLEAERGFRMNLEQQVRGRTAQLTETNRELDSFAYTISHDLRAPLRAMHGFAEAVMEDYGPALPQEGQHYLRRIRSAALRMDGLIADILTYSRLTREEITLRPTSLETVVDQVLANSATLLEETEAGIAVERPLPAVNAHRPTLTQAVDNLISNAVKFVSPGTRPDVRIRAERRAGMVRLMVEDNGVGIDPVHRERIFRPFERLHGVESYPGTGIGLAIVRRSAERMGGTCGVEPNPAGGSRFWIELHVAPEASP